MKPGAFSVTYRGAVEDALRFVTPGARGVLARHHPGFADYDFGAYLRLSERRYRHVLRLARRAGVLDGGPPHVLDVGGFLAAFPVALARLGWPVTLVEEYGYYEGAFDGLRDLLVAEGVTVVSADYTQPLDEPPARYGLVTNLAMLEHLANSPRVLMENLRASTADDGLLVLEVPNIAYWPRRMALLRGETVHPPLSDVYESAIPFLGHHREYTRDDLAWLLERGGFTVEDVARFNYSVRVAGPWMDRVYALRSLAVPALLPSAREAIMASGRPRRAAS
jgi:SAM-dependent methyltransferase